MSVKGATNQTPINQIDQSPVPQGGASGVKEHKPPTFTKIIIGKLCNTSLSSCITSSKQRTCSTNSTKGTEEAKSKNFREGAKAFGNFLLEGIKKHIPEPPILKLAKKFVQHLENIDTSKSFSENISNAFKPLKTALGDFKQKVFQELGEKVKNHPHTSQIFVKLFKEKLLKSENKTIFNNLPMEAKKTFIEQNKDDIGFLSEFSNVYKEESFSGQPIPELLTAFKDAIVSNRDQIIKDPTILASADKASIFAVADAIKDDIPLQKALIQSYTHVTKEIAEEALKTNNQESKLINQETTDNFAKLLKGEITQEDFGSIESVQILSDGARGFTFDFSCPSGKVTLTKEANERIDENGEKHFLSKQEILNTILEQSKKFTPDDKKALADFVTNCAVQGLFAGQIPGTTVCLKIDGDGVPFIKAQANPDGLKVNVVTKGTCKDTLGSVTFSDNSTLSLDKIEVEKNEFSLFYPTSILKCNGKAEKIEVLEINQKQGLPLTQEENITNNALRKIKNEDGLNGSVTIDEFNALMSNPQILNENIEFLDKNPAALRKIPKEILQSNIQNALDAKNEPLAKALTKGLDYLDPNAFENKLLEANKKKNLKKSEKNAEPLFRFFSQDNTPTILGNKNFEVLSDAIRQAEVKFITKNGTEITIGGYKFNNKPQEALNDIKQQIKEKELEDAEIKALADFIANGYVQTYLNFENQSVGPYCWDGDGKVHVTAQMSDKGLDVNVKTQGSDNTATIFTAPQSHNPAKLEKTVNADVTFHYKGSIGEAQGVVDHISVKRFEQEIGDVTIYQF